MTGLSFRQYKQISNCKCHWNTIYNFFKDMFSISAFNLFFIKAKLICISIKKIIINYYNKYYLLFFYFNFLQSNIAL